MSGGEGALQTSLFGAERVENLSQRWQQTPVLWRRRWSDLGQRSAFFGVALELCANRVKEITGNGIDDFPSEFRSFFATLPGVLHDTADIFVHVAVTRDGSLEGQLFFSLTSGDRGENGS